MASLRERVAYAWRALREGAPLASGAYDEDELFRRITSSSRDLSGVSQTRAQEISFSLWRQNPMARRLIEMIVDFVVGDGFDLEASDERVGEVIDEFWSDPVMRLDLRHRDWVRDLALNGELAFRAFVNETSGRTRLGYIDPLRIERVTKDPENALIDRVLSLKRPAAAAPEVLTIVNIEEGSDASAPELVGDAFYFAINRLTTGTRGTPDLLALADWIDGYDQILFNALERTGLMNAFIWDVTLEGADSTAVDDWVRKYGTPPRPGTVRAHSDREKWEAVAPNMGAYEVAVVARMVKNLVLGGAGVPEAWFADGDSANRATLAAQGDPTYRMLTARQKLVRYIFEDIVRWVIDRAVAHGRLPLDVDRSFTITTPEPSSKDVAQITSAVTQLAASIAAAIDEQLISRDSGRKIFLMLASQLGMELDPTNEAMAIAEEAASAAERLVPEPPAGLERLLDPARGDGAIDRETAAAALASPGRA